MFYLFWGCYTLHTYNYDTSTCYSNIFSLQIATVKFATILECLPPSFTRPQKLKQFSIDSSIMDVWNTTKSPTQQKSGYLVSSTAFWIAESLVMFFGNQEVYHVVLGNMIKTILKPCTKITISSFFFCRKSHGDGIRPSNQFQPPGPTICLAACSCTQRPWHATKPLHASNFLLDDQRMLCQWSSFQIGGFNHKFLVD